MSKKKTYWERRATRYEKEWDKRCEETIEKRLARQYQGALSTIKDDILKLYAIFAKDNGMDFDEARRFLSSKEFREWRMTMQEYLRLIADGDKGLELELNTLAMRPRITRLEKLYAETLQELDKLGRDVNKQTKDFLSDAYKSSYTRDIFDMVKVGGLSVAVAKLDNIGVAKVLAARWSGKNYSQRIWTNTRLLSHTIKKVVADGVHRGLSIDQLSKMVEDKMHAGYKNAVRLVRTEMNFVNNQAHANSMKDAGIDSYEFIAVLDNKTSAKCRARDGEVYSLEEKSVGFNYPPLHPRCRSTVAPYIEGISKKGTRAAKDKSGKNIDIPAAMKYSDYESVYIKKEKSLEAWKKEHSNIPKFKAIDYNDVAKVRSNQEFVAMGQELQPIAEKYTGRKSLWSGKIVFTDVSAKNWDCNIWLKKDTPKHVLLHEMIHSCSASYYTPAEFSANRFKEELVVQLLCQEISIAEKIPIVSGGYDEGVMLIRDFKKALKLNISDLEFAKNLLNQPLAKRWDYLEELLANVLNEGFTFEDYGNLLKKLEGIKSWPLSQEKV